jgi:hypothetical protein
MWKKEFIEAMVRDHPRGYAGWTRSKKARRYLRIAQLSHNATLAIMTDAASFKAGTAWHVYVLLIKNGQSEMDTFFKKSGEIRVSSAELLLKDPDSIPQTSLFEKLNEEEKAKAFEFVKEKDKTTLDQTW